MEILLKKDKQEIPIYHKLNLTIEEAALYSNIEEHHIRALIKTPECPFVLFVGKKPLIKRKAFEEFLDKDIIIMYGESSRENLIDVHEESQNELQEKCCEGSCVYFISDGEYVKIGMTKNIEKRLAELQTANARRLNVIKIIPTDNPGELERLLHKIYASKHVSNEWFDIKDEIDKEISMGALLHE